MGDAPAIEAALHGDVKAFFVAGDARPWFGLSDDAEALFASAGLTERDALAAYGLDAAPFGQGIAAGRLKLEVTRGDALRFDAHWAIAASSAASAGLVPGMSSGVGLTAPEALPLTWRPDTGDDLGVVHRVDRLVLAAQLPRLDVTLGRQPVSFGSGRFFTPLDLVNPFHPATIDSEYKPGVDALRVDAYAGVAGRLTVAAAWAGDAPLAGPDRTTAPALDDVVLAANGQGTVGVTDLGGFAGVVHGEPVLGLGVVSAVGPVGVHADATVTVPEGGDPFVRAVAGADGRPTATTTVMGEVYAQSFGGARPEDYLAALDDPRFLRGEVWQLGQVYGAVSVAQEITPLVAANVAVIANVRDPSALVAAGGSWSLADDADLVFGTYLGVGEAPDVVDLDVALDPETLAPALVPPSDAALAASVNGEFGLYPRMAYLQVRTYF